MVLWKQIILASIQRYFFAATWDQWVHQNLLSDGINWEGLQWNEAFIFIRWRLWK